MSSGSRTFSSPPISEEPVGLPVEKVEAALQASGEVRFTSDLAFGELASTLFAAPVLVDRANALIVSLDASAALACPGVQAFISAADLQALGANNQIPNSPYLVFATSEAPTQCVGQFVGLVVASAASVAVRAAKLVTITYQTDPQTKPKGLWSATQALTAGGHAIQTMHFDYVRTAYPRGHPGARASDVAFSASIKTTGQKHFYMETQSALATPGANGSLEVRCASQWLVEVRQQVASVLNLKLTSVTVRLQLRQYKLITSPLHTHHQ